VDVSFRDIVRWVGLSADDVVNLRLALMSILLNIAGMVLAFITGCESVDGGQGPAIAVPRRTSRALRYVRVKRERRRKIPTTLEIVDPGSLSHSAIALVSRALGSLN
jgi:hypothetical protein